MSLLGKIARKTTNLVQMRMSASDQSKVERFAKQLINQLKTSNAAKGSESFSVDMSDSFSDDLFIALREQTDMDFDEALDGAVEKALKEAGLPGGSASYEANVDVQLKNVKIVFDVTLTASVRKK